MRTCQQARIYVLNSKKTVKENNICIEQQENSKGKQCSKETHKIIVKDPQISMKYFIIFS